MNDTTTIQVGATHCSVSNPTPRARVIYDGIKNARPIRIMPGQTIETFDGKPLLLSDLTIERLKRSENAVPGEPDLHVELLGESETKEVTKREPPAEQLAVTQPQRKPRLVTEPKA